MLYPLKPLFGRLWKLLIIHGKNYASIIYHFRNIMGSTRQYPCIYMLKSTRPKLFFYYKRIRTHLRIDVHVMHQSGNEVYSAAAWHTNELYTSMSLGCLRTFLWSNSCIATFITADPVVGWLTTWKSWRLRMPGICWAVWTLSTTQLIYHYQ